MAGRFRNRRKKRSYYFDYNLLVILILIMCFGLVVLYSASSYTSGITYNDPMYYFKRQLVFSGISFVAMLVVSRIDYRFWKKIAFFSYILSIVLIILVLTPLGVEVNGARRWLGVEGFPMNLQPAEAAKIAMIIFLPYLICLMGKKVKTLKGVIVVFMSGALIAALVYFITENLSTAIIIMGMCAVTIYVVHPKTLPFIAAGGAGIAVAGAGLYYLIQNIGSDSGFRLQRIMAWLNPEEYASGRAYQTLQGLYAIGNGGLFGKGLGNSTQKIYVPEVQNDMIFSIICEELGMFGALMVVILFALLLFRLMFIAQNAPDLYGALLVTGIFAHISIQVLLNIAVVLNVIPTTGITLPFISYGGSSALFLLSEMGLALGVSRRIELKE